MAEAELAAAAGVGAAAEVVAADGVLLVMVVVRLWFRR